MSFIRRQVGLRTDAASASGSLHAKVTDLKNWLYGYLSNTIYPRTDAFNAKVPRIIVDYFQNTGSATGPIVNISGSGYLTGISSVCRTDSTGAHVTLQITIDGNVVLDNITPTIRFVTPGNKYNIISGFLRFNNSLKIELAR